MFAIEWQRKVRDLFYWFYVENDVFPLHGSIKTKILSLKPSWPEPMTWSWKFWKSQKVISVKKNQAVLIAKISSRQTQKIANPLKYTPTKNLVLHGSQSNLISIDDLNWF